MDVNQVRFGNYSIGNPQGGSPKKSEEKPNEFNQDYLEIVPVGIINNLSKPEDIY